MSNEYEQYLPEIDVAVGLTRVMKNMNLYVKLLKKFDPYKMIDQLVVLLKDKDYERAIQITHAMRGTAANLSFDIVRNLANEIELLCKEKKDPMHLIEPLKTAVDELNDKMALLIESHESQG